MNTLIDKSNSTCSNMIINNATVNDPAVISNAFSLHFAQTPQVQSSFFHPEPTVNPQPSDSSFTFRQVSSADVQLAISKLSSSSGPGPDGIEGKFIKISSHVLSSPLAELFNLSFLTHEVPLAWKCTKVIPLHKGGDTQNMNNYRPLNN